MKSFAASWIWLGSEEHQKLRVSWFDKSPTPPGMALFRKTFNLQSVDNCLARFSGDCKYRIRINGVFICDGPPEAGGDFANTQAPDWWFYDVRDIGEFLKYGENLIEAEVMMDCEAQTDYSVGRGGFIFELTDAEGNIVLKTDRSWEAALNLGWRPGHYDARQEPTAWKPAAEIADPPWQLRELGLPPLAIREIVPNCRLPHCFLPGVPQLIDLHFDEKVCGHFEIELSGQAGAILRIAYAEVPGIFTPAEQEVYCLKNGRQTFRATRMRVCMDIRLTIEFGSFFANDSAPVTVHGVKFINRHFPVELQPLETSDEALNRVRDCCAATLKICMQRLHLDSPIHQEGLGCTGDYMIESLMSYYLFGETRLAAADTRRTALLLRQKNGVMFHTSYSLLWITMIHDYYLYSGDLELVKEVLPEIRLVLELFRSYLGPTGLVSEAPNYMFVDWVYQDGFAYHHPPASHGTGVMTAFYIRALEEGAKLTGTCEWLELAQELKENFRRELWDENKGFFRNGTPHLSKSPPAKYLPPDDDEFSYSMHCNIAAISSGIIDDPGFLERVMTHPWPVQPQPYYLHFVFDAIRRAGQFDRFATDLLKLWNRIVDEHPFGLKECWQCGDYCHAWGGTPVIQTGRDILGAEPLEPGWRHILLAPHPLTLTHASGKIHTVMGTVKINWRIENGIFHYRAELPRGMKHTFKPPHGLTVDQIILTVDA